jgi:phage tail sheath gpL-like
MPDNITFNTIPVDIRTPGQYIEVDNTKAVRGLPSQNRRVLFIGNKLAAGAAIANQLYRINSAAEAAGLFGRGSVLQEMLVAARVANIETDFWAIGMIDEVAGVQATQTVTVTGPATAAGTISLMINGTRVAVGVASGDAAAAIATAIAAAVTAWADAPVTAAAAAAVATLTAKHKGAFTSDIDCRVNYYDGEVLPAGVGVVVAAGVAGTTNPDVATALATIADEAFYDIVTPWNDVANIGKLEVALAARWGGMDMRTGHAWGGKLGTQANLSTFGAARNSPHSTFIGYKSAPQPTYVWASVFAVVCEASGAIDPARPFQTLPLPGILPPARADRFTRQERDLLLRDGISTFTVDQGGNVLVERVITTYQVNAYGIDDISYLDLNTKWTVDYIRYAVRARIALRFPRHKLADDGTSFAPGQAIATPNMIRGELLALGRDLESAGIIENFNQFKDDLVVVRSLSDRNRVNCILPPDIVNQLRVFAASVQYLL